MIIVIEICIIFIIIADEIYIKIYIVHARVIRTYYYNDIALPNNDNMARINKARKYSPLAEDDREHADFAARAARGTSEWYYGDGGGSVQHFRSATTGRPSCSADTAFVERRGRLKFESAAPYGGGLYVPRPYNI
jgi:hypothetical protein